MNRVFGEEHFLDSTMVYVAKQTDNIILDEIHKATMRVGVQVDEEKLKRWLKLCGELEHIDKSALIDIATQKKFADKDEQIRSLEEQLKNAKPKFDVGQKVYYAPADIFYRDSIARNCPRTAIITDVLTSKKTEARYELDNYDILNENKLFATREEALNRLAEMEGK